MKNRVYNLRQKLCLAGLISITLSMQIFPEDYGMTPIEDDMQASAKEYFEDNMSQKYKLARGLDENE